MRTAPWSPEGRARVGEPPTVGGRRDLGDRKAKTCPLAAFGPLASTRSFANAQAELAEPTAARS